MLQASEFVTLMEQLTRAWNQQDTELGLGCFCHDAVYMEPPDIQLYLGHAQFRPYFAALRSGTLMHWHHLMFDQANQVGMGEYSFGVADQPSADHGVAVVELRQGRIAIWREYQRKGPSSFSEFLSTQGKAWQWHIGNYP